PGPNDHRNVSADRRARGAVQQVRAPDERPGGTLTSWDARIEGSLDSANWTQIAQQNATDGATVFVVDKPANFIRLNLAALSLGTATSINVYVVSSNGI